MRLLQFPDDVAIGGLEAQADHLADDAARAAAEAEALALSLFRGDASWRDYTFGAAAAAPRSAFPRRVA